MAMERGQAFHCHQRDFRNAGAPAVAISVNFATAEPLRLANLPRHIAVPKLRDPPYEPLKEEAPLFYLVLR